MEQLSIQLVFHGVLVLVVSILGGVVLWRVLLKQDYGPQWHLLHAGGTVRGVLLIALSSVLHFPVLPLTALSIMIWLFIISIWASVFAMLIAALTGDRGLQNRGAFANRLIYLLYVIHAVTLIPAFLILMYGLIRAM
jgi:hypothetical protein